MAIQSAIPVNFDAFFPRGAFVVGEVELAVSDSDEGCGDRCCCRGPPHLRGCWQALR